MMHYYKRNIGDYHKKAGRLSMLEHGAYNLLIDACYDREQFPTEADAIEWCWARSEDEIAAVKFVLSRFFMLEDGVFVQHRIKDELHAYREKAEKNARIAKEREENRTNRARNVNGSSPELHESSPNQEPITTNHKPITKNQEIQDPPLAPPSASPQGRQKSKSGTRLPEDWSLPDEWRSWSETNTPGLNLDRVAPSFRDYWCPKTGKDATKLDWFGTWRNWCRREHERTQSRPGNGTTKPKSDSPQAHLGEFPRY